MMLSIRPLAIALTLMTGACATEHEQTAGGFALQQLDGLARTSDPSGVTSQTDFDLGEVMASRDFYFILSNTGTADITDITLTSSSPAFAVEPSAISVLTPGGGAIIPIVRVSAVHGRAVDGVGLAPLLPKGLNNGMITIRGTTMGTNGAEVVELVAAVTVNARVMDIELWSGTQAIDLTSPQGSISTNLGGLGFARSYPYTVANGVQLKNVGNIDIALTFYEDNHVIGQANASPTQTVQVTLGDTTFVAVASGAVTDDKRLQLGNDGVGYFALWSR